MQVQLLPVDSKGFINYDYVIEQVARNNPSFTFNKLVSAVYAEDSTSTSSNGNVDLSAPTGGL